MVDEKFRKHSVNDLCVIQLKAALRAGGRRVGDI